MRIYGWKTGADLSKNLSYSATYAIFFAILGGFGLSVTSFAAWALPPDPQRAFTAQSCDAALARLAEARTGSPLISAAELQDVQTQARQQAARLCGAGYDQMSDHSSEPKLDVTGE